jgi:hypothetical protein
MQWIGWSRECQLPEEHAHDWPAELEAGRRPHRDLTFVPFLPSRIRADGSLQEAHTAGVACQQFVSSLSANRAKLPIQANIRQHVQSPKSCIYQ